MFEDIDQDQDGFIDYHEFQAAACDKERLFSTDNIDLAFKLLASEQKTSITKASLAKVFGLDSFKLAKGWDSFIGDETVSRLAEISRNDFEKLLKPLKSSGTSQECMPITVNLLADLNKKEQSSSQDANIVSELEDLQNRLNEIQQ